MGKSADGRHVSHLSECESCQVDSQEYWPLKTIRCILDYLCQYTLHNQMCMSYKPQRTRRTPQKETQTRMQDAASHGSRQAC